jgi:L-ascorbate metabolism protein UlaG (beta-lactamase superfamily)
MYLGNDVYFKVLYADKTAFGSSIGDRPDWTVRRCFKPLLAKIEKHGYQAIVHSTELLRDCTESSEFSAIASSVTDVGWILRPEFLYPETKMAYPEKLYLFRERTGEFCEIGIGQTDWPEIHALLAALSSRRGASELRVDRDIADLLDIFENKEITRTDAPTPHVRGDDCDLLFIGHNTVMIRSAKKRLLLDPLLFSDSGDLPHGYIPLQLSDLGPVDGILITHSHPDHFDPATLLRFATDITIIVPRNERETVLCVDMEYRLRELGFYNVIPTNWGDRIEFDDITVYVLPFYGEQPTTGMVLHPEVRNLGNTYRIETPNLSAMFLADSGRDISGSVFAMAEEARRTYGSVNYVFTGCRGWVTYPPQLLLASVARYFAFVPPLLWGARQNLMMTAEEAMDVAERFGADYVIPYADGGAPWHWRIGLGPNLASGEIVHGFDVPPEHLVCAARSRTTLPDFSRAISSVKPLVLRPNDGIKHRPSGPVILRETSNFWHATVGVRP